MTPPMKHQENLAKKSKTSTVMGMLRFIMSLSDSCYFRSRLHDMIDWLFYMFPTLGRVDAG
jgi:hypothetical protein